MSFFGSNKSRNQQKHKKAYGEGLKEGRGDGIISSVIKGSGRIMSDMVPSTSEYKSYRKGVEDSGKKRK
jgi:hypothetical protein